MTLLLLPILVFGPGLLLGLLSGVWALSVLSAPEVKAAFEHNARLPEVAGPVKVRK